MVCVSHITSLPAVIMPIKEIAIVCRDRGVPLMVDGAHALGQLDLDLTMV